MTTVPDGTAQDDGVVEDDGFVDEDSTDGEDITQNVDPDALGEDIKESSTEDPSLQEETMGEAVEGEDGAVDEETGIPEATEDGTALDGTAQDDMAVAPEENTEEIPEATEDGTVLDEQPVDDMSVTPGENTAEDPLNTDSLSEEAKASFEQAKALVRESMEEMTASEWGNGRGCHGISYNYTGGWCRSDSEGTGILYQGTERRRNELCSG